MFKVFNDVAVDTKKVAALYVDNVGLKNKMVYSVKAAMDNGDEWTLAEFGNKEEDAVKFLKEVATELNAQ